jgi:hypothetical protein
LTNYEDLNVVLNFKHHNPYTIIEGLSIHYKVFKKDFTLRDFEPLGIRRLEICDIAREIDI